MNSELDPRDDLTERLRALGRSPIDRGLQSQHLTAMAAAGMSSSRRGTFASRVRVGVAVFGGFMLGATGLASAGAMGPLQPIVKTTVEAVTPFELPEAAKKGQQTAADARAKGNAAKADKGGKADVDATALAAEVDGTTDSAAAAEADPKTPKNWEGCVAEFGRTNRGQYLKAAKEKGAAEFEAARKSDCGKALDAAKSEADDNPDAPKAEGTGTADDKKAGTPSSSSKSKDDPSSDPKAADTQDKPKRDRGDGAATDGSGSSRSGVDAPPTSTTVEPDPSKGRGNTNRGKGGAAGSQDDTSGGRGGRPTPGS